MAKKKPSTPRCYWCSSPDHLEAACPWKDTPEELAAPKPYRTPTPAEQEAFFREFPEFAERIPAK